MEKLFEGYFVPESVAIDKDGTIYTGLFDGRILRISPDGKDVEVFAEAVEPLGVEFDAQGNLIIADATLGLISVDNAGNITVLTKEVDGMSCLLAVRGEGQESNSFGCAGAGRLSIRRNTPFFRELAPGGPSLADDRPAGYRGQERYRQDRPAPWKAGIWCRYRGRRGFRKRRGG